MALNPRFGGKERSSVFEKLAKLKQNGRVEDYIQEFERLVSQAPLTGEEQLLGYFFVGLQPKIQNQIKPHDPKEVMKAMEIALDVEEAFKEEKGGSSGYKNTTSFGRSRITGHTELYRETVGQCRLVWLVMQERRLPPQAERFDQGKAQGIRGPKHSPTWSM